MRSDSHRIESVPTGGVLQRARLLAAVLLSVLMAIAGCSVGVPADSGIRGEVRIGPVSPVETPGTPASKPYAATLEIRPADGGRAVRAKSGADGRFSVNLAPGAYVIEPEQGNPLPTAQPVTVEVEPHRFTPVVIDYDSGIR